MRGRQPLRFVCFEKASDPGVTVSISATAVRPPRKHCDVRRDLNRAATLPLNDGRGTAKSNRFFDSGFAVSRDFHSECKGNSRHLRTEIAKCQHPKICRLRGVRT